MTNNHKKSPMPGQAGVFKPAFFEPCSGKTYWIELVDPNDNGHTLMFGSTRDGMSGMFARPRDEAAKP